MPIVPVTLPNIQAGALIDEANAHLDIAFNDAIQRAMIGKPRKVTLSVEIAPKTAPSGETILEIDWEAKHSIPGSGGLTSRAYIRDVNGVERAVVNVNDPLGESVPEQTTVFDIDQKQ